MPQSIRDAMQIQAGSRLTCETCCALDDHRLCQNQLGSRQNLASLLVAAELSFESETTVAVALELLRQNKADSPHGLHSGLSHAAGMAPLCTFDPATWNMHRGQWLLN